MNVTPENDDPTTDDLHDRLVDRALCEVVGKDAPPDLSERILKMEPQLAVTSASPDAPARRFGRSRWLALAVAAMLMLCAVPLMLPSIGDLRKSQSVDRGVTEQVAAARSDSAAASNNSLARPAPASEAQRPSALYMTDDVQYYSPSPSATAQSVPSDNIGLPVLINDATVSLSKSGDTRGVSEQSAGAEKGTDVPQFTSDLDVPFRQDSFAFTQAVPPQNAPDAPRAHRLTATDLGDISLESGGPAREQLYGSMDLKSKAGLLAFNDEEAQRRFAVEGRLGNESFGGLRPNKETELGTGPGLPGDQYTRIFENPFIKAIGPDAVSTFSIDVDTASYSNVRQFLLQLGQLPPADAVRIEELVNYFEYDYAPPQAEDEAPFAAHVEVAGCPWAAEHRLVRIGIKGREMERDKRPQSNLVFLVDVSGSMNEPAKLPLVVQGLEQLTRELGENDRVAIVVYASSEGLVLPSTPGTKQQEILAALGQLQAGGSTAGGAGIQLAYQIAEDNFIEGGTNRVILCTDGDFNVGVTSTAELERLVEQKAKDTKVFLSVLGFGRGNLNDAMMEAISNHGNGNYFYVDNRTEARRVLVEQMTGTLVTIAKDVKIQVEFNPRQVAGYRLLGYENRMLRTEDFNDDKKDAGEIGAGHTVTALYEIVPAGKDVNVAPVDELKYQQKASGSPADDAPLETELLTLKMRYKAPEGDTSKKLEWPVSDDGKGFAAATTDFQFAASVAGLGLMLRDSQHKGNLTYAAVLELASSSKGSDEHGYRAEFVEMVRKAKELRKE